MLNGRRRMSAHCGGQAMWREAAADAAPARGGCVRMRDFRNGLAGQAGAEVPNLESPDINDGSQTLCCGRTPDGGERMRYAAAL